MSQVVQMIALKPDQVLHHVFYPEHRDQALFEPIEPVIIGGEIVSYNVRFLHDSSTGTISGHDLVVPVDQPFNEKESD